MSPLFGMPAASLIARGACGRMSDRVDHQGIALPMADRMAVERRFGIVGMRTAVGVDAAQPVAVGFAEHRHASGREQDLHRVVGDQHPGRMSLRGNNRRRPAAVGRPFSSANMWSIFFFAYSFHGGGLVLTWASWSVNFRIPYAAPIRQFAMSCPVLRGRCRVDDGRHLWGRPDRWGVLGGWAALGEIATIVRTANKSA
jgi:hypothetical protein